MKENVMKKAIRYVVLVAIVVVSGYLLFNNTSGSDNNACQTESICGKCDKVNTCSLPAAKVYKKNKANVDTVAIELKHQ